MGWALHNHPLFGTVWADLAELPPILDQSSALGGGTLVLVDEYEGPVNDPASARRAVEQMGDVVHGAAGRPRRVRARRFGPGRSTSGRWRSSSAASTPGTPAPPEVRAPPGSRRHSSTSMARSDGEGFIGFWEAAVRAELAADPDLLD